MTSGLNAFDAPTLSRLEQLIENPVDRFGNQIYCKSCTVNFKHGANQQRCLSRAGRQTSHLCPFRQAFDAETLEALAEA